MWHFGQNPLRKNGNSQMREIFAVGHTFMNTSVRKRKAFTLIELLVVIAIIAILAAILFPVFAQAKEAAKKTQGLSQAKQVGTGIMIYTADYDDNYPIMIIPNSGGNWQYNLTPTVPANWFYTTQSIINRHEVFWVNTTYPYLKNSQILSHPSGNDSADSATTTTGIAPYKIGLAANGLLSTYTQTAIDNPSTVTLLWNGHGKTNWVGRSFAVPALRCGGPVNGTCRFNPSGYPDSWNGGGSAFGSAWFVPSGLDTNWAYQMGVITVRTDTSAKFIKIGRVGGGSGGYDYLRDPWSNYDASGKAISYTGCRPSGSASNVPYYWCFFRPDRTE